MRSLWVGAIVKNSGGAVGKVTRVYPASDAAHVLWGDNDLLLWYNPDGKCGGDRKLWGRYDIVEVLLPPEEQAVLDTMKEGT